MMTCLETIDVVLLAGGLGTRLRPVDQGLPKVLAPVAGRPFLVYLLDWLGSFGARRIVIALGYRASSVLDFLSTFQRAGLLIETMIEVEPLGTAGAIRNARSRLRSDPVLVANADSFVAADLCALLAHHRAHAAPGTLVCSEVPSTERYGRVVLDGNGRVRHFVEKDASRPGPGLVSAGMYLLSGALLDQIAASTSPSLERDYFATLPAGTLAAFAGTFDFTDIGTPESLRLAQEFLPARFDRSSSPRP